MRTSAVAALACGTLILSACSSDPAAQAAACDQVSALEQQVNSVASGSSSTTVGDVRTSLADITTGLDEAKGSAGNVADVVIEGVKSAVAQVDKTLAGQPADKAISDLPAVKTALDAVKTGYDALKSQVCSA